MTEIKEGAPRLIEIQNGISLEIGMPLPRVVEFQFQNIPAEIRDLPQWVVFRFIPVKNWRPGAAKTWTKMPVNPITGREARSTDPKTWGSFDETIAYFQLHKDEEDPRAVAHGIGFMTTRSDPYTCGDLDHHVTGGNLDALAIEITAALHTYTEFSVSGTGLRLLFRAGLPTGCWRHDSLGIEFYSWSQFLTITGAVVDGRNKIENRDNELDTLLRRGWPKVSGHNSTSLVSGKVLCANR